MFAQTITTEEKVTFTLTPQTAQGNPATVDGAPVWTRTEGDVTLEVAADGLSCTVLSGAGGVLSKITVTADAALDAEVVNISEEILLTVIPAGAASLAIGATVEPK